MVDFIVLTLLFLDTNTNNVFDANDKIININAKSSIVQNVYCEVDNWTASKLCWYSSNNTSFISEDEYSDLLLSLEWKHYIYNTEIFEKGFKPWRVLYAEYISWKYIFKKDESKLNKNNTIYSLSNNDSLYFNQILNKSLILFGIIMTVFIAWLILFPKKVK